MNEEKPGPGGPSPEVESRAGSGGKHGGPVWVDVVALVLALVTFGVIVAVLVENFLGAG